VTDDRIGRRGRRAQTDRVRAISIVAGVAVVVLGARPARAEEASASIGGVVRHRYTGEPIAGADVFVAGPSGLAHTTVTDAAGAYLVSVTPGTYAVVFAVAGDRASQRVTVGAGKLVRVDATLDRGEVIEIRDLLLPEPQRARPKGRRGVAPPYSDKAILQDAWTKAWLLLDIDPHGEVTRVKLLRRPGYDLDEIAVKQAFKLKFHPATDATGRPIRTLLVHPIEWPSYWWLVTHTGVTTYLPSPRGLPCKGSGEPLNLDRAHPVYRDCSVPDMTLADREPWLTRP
jgi:hypothetical protein